MSGEYISLGSAGGVKLSVRVWRIPKPQGIVQISHGMAEHIDRYDHFARTLNEEGFIVYGHDHRGHGKTAGDMENTGYFADEDGWTRVVEDLHEVSLLAKKENPDLPLFLFAHSMGSFIARHYIALYGDELKGVILSGTGGDPGLLGKVGLWIARGEKKKRGARARSPKLDNLSFGNFNKAFRPNRTAFDWLSRDPEQVDRYVEDPYCGFICTAGFFVDLLEGLQKINSPEMVKKIPHDLPVLFMAGAMDPVGNQTKAVRKVAESYRNAGILDVREKYYEGGRHESLNEINRDQVAIDIINWFKNHLS